jgi:hypothetical protein
VFDAIVFWLDLSGFLLVLCFGGVLFGLLSAFVAPAVAVDVVGPDGEGALYGAAVVAVGGVWAGEVFFGGHFFW